MALRDCNLTEADDVDTRLLSALLRRNSLASSVSVGERGYLSCCNAGWIWIKSLCQSDDSFVNNRRDRLSTRDIELNRHSDDAVGRGLQRCRDDDGDVRVLA
jgi:hypothetical protein